MALYISLLTVFGMLLGMAGLQAYYLYCWRRLSEDTRQAIVIAILHDREMAYGQNFQQLKAEGDEEKVVPDGWSEIIA